MSRDKSDGLESWVLRDIAHELKRIADVMEKAWADVAPDIEAGRAARNEDQQ